VGTVVGLVHVNDSSKELKNSIMAALDLVDFKFNPSVNSVIIKPNLCYYWNSSTGYTTDPRIVASIIDIVREKCGEHVSIKVAEADASAMRTKFAFPVLGYSKLAEDKKIELLNLSEDELVETSVSVNNRDLSFKVPQSLLKADLLINVPKLKILRATKITCAMKNMFGANGVPRKNKYHPFLEEAIVGINKLLRPHLTIVDGIIALGRHPVRLNLIMASKDPFSVDWVSSKLMGYNPAKVKFLKLSIKEKIGNPTGITTKGANLTEFQRIFPQQNFSSSKYWWNIQFYLVKAYQKLSGDIIPPALEE
jgi:uncharacterized protein (DUF362 family)